MCIIYRYEDNKIIKEKKSNMLLDPITYLSGFGRFAYKGDVEKSDISPAFICIVVPKVISFVGHTPTTIVDTPRA